MNESEILIIGAKGQLGLALQEKYPGAQTADIDELDITDQTSVANFDWSSVRLVLNAAAYTNVDAAETMDGRVTAWRVNAEAVGYLVKAAWDHNLTLVHISTDYVFDGKTEIHSETEDFSPLSVYGASKAAGDLLVSLLPKHYILRTSWVIGEGKNFVRTMLGVGQRKISPSVVNDQLGRLTFTSELVGAINHLITQKSAPGTYNVSNDGDVVSWAEITREIFRDAGFSLRVNDVSTKDYYAGKENIAPRPACSTLNLDKIHAAGFVSHDWRADLKSYIEKELNQT